MNNQPNNSAKAKSSRDTILDYLKQEIESVVKFHTQNPIESEWNLEEIYEVIDTIFPLPLAVRIKLEEIRDLAGTDEQDKTARGKLISYLSDLATVEYEKLESRINNDSSFAKATADRQNIKSQMSDKIKPMRMVEKSLLLQSIDTLWVEHIDAIDHMRQGIGLRGYGQKDPLVEYKKEAHRMFQQLLANIRKQVVYSIFKVGLSPAVGQETEKLRNKETKQMNFSGPAKTGAVSTTIKQVDQDATKKVGRNDPCPCGSGKKYKKCCGR